MTNPHDSCINDTTHDVIQNTKIGMKNVILSNNIFPSGVLSCIFLWSPLSRVMVRYEREIGTSLNHALNDYE